MRSIFIFLIAFILLFGCKVGPNYHYPHVTLPTKYEEVLPEKTEEIEDEDLIHWWKVFNDPCLDDLIDLALEGNFDYRIAIERVFQARSQYWVQFTQILPEFDADSLSTRYRASTSFASITPLNAAGAVPANGAAASTATLSPYRNFYQVGLDAIWEIDFFGKLRRAADASYDLWEATADEMRGVKLTLISEVAATYTAIRAYQQKRNIALQSVELDREILESARVRFDAGLADQQDVENANVSLQSNEAQLDILQAELKQTIYSLSILVGALPEVVIDWFQHEGEIPQARGKVPVSLPSNLLRRRPDIRSAERQLAAATEQIGVAVADLFPSISLAGSSSSYAANPLQGANIGYSSDNLGKLFRPASSLWGYGLLVTQPVLDFGKRNAAIEVQIALRNQAYYTYQKSVIAALQETEQALEIYFNDEAKLKSITKETESNRIIFILTSDLFQAGLANYSQFLEAKNQWIASQSQLVDAEEGLTTDLITVYKALGGDW